MSREVQVQDNNVALATILEKMQAMEEEMNDLIEENKQLRKLNQKLKTTSQQKTKKIKQPDMLFGSIDEEFCEYKLLQLRQNNDIEGIKRYISAYYAKIPDAKFVMKYCKTENKYEYIDSSLFKNNILKPLEIKFIDEQGRKSKYNFID
jgi:hypothetical protein